MAVSMDNAPKMAVSSARKGISWMVKSAQSALQQWKAALFAPLPPLALSAGAISWYYRTTPMDVSVPVRVITCIRILALAAVFAKMDIGWRKTAARRAAMSFPAVHNATKHLLTHTSQSIKRRHFLLITGSTTLTVRLVIIIATVCEPIPTCN